MPLHEAARAAGVKFHEDAVPGSGFVEANGLCFHYLEWGDPKNRSIVMLHGMGQTAHSWDFAALALCDRYHIVALDQRGHGDSAGGAAGAGVTFGGRTLHPPVRS